MNIAVRAWLVVLALSLPTLFPIAALAKSPPDKLTVDGPGLAEPVEITEAAELSKFSPWTRGFIAWDRGLVAVPPQTEKTYTVSFYIQTTKIYVLEYVPEPSNGPGYIYIPGPGHPAYRLNIGTIITGDSDRWDPNGKWHHATPEWGRVISRALRTHSSGAATWPVSQVWILAGTGAGLASALGWVLWRVAAHKRVWFGHRGFVRESEGDLEPTEKRA